MTLTKPCILAPIKVPAAGWSNDITGQLAAGPVLDLDFPSIMGVGAGDYYLSGDAEAWDWLEALAQAVNSVMGVNLTYSIDYTTGLITMSQDHATDRLTLTFNQLDTIGPYLLGFNTSTTHTTIKLEALDADNVAPRHCARRWAPNDYAFHPETPTRAKVSAPRTLSGANGLLYEWGSYTERRLILPAVRGARVYQWAAEDSQNFGFATAAGFSTRSQNHGTLETLAKEVRELAANYDQEPPPLAHFLSSVDDNPRVVHWVDAGALEDVGVVARQVSPEPLLYRVELVLIDQGLV